MGRREKHTNLLVETGVVNNKYKSVKILENASVRMAVGGHVHLRQLFELGALLPSLLSKKHFRQEREQAACYRPSDGQRLLDRCRMESNI